MTPGDLLDLLVRMQAHAVRTREAMRALDTRRLFELATEGAELARTLEQALARVDRGPQWAEARRRAQQVHEYSRANEAILARSLEVVRALKPHAPHPDAPAFVSQKA